MKLEPLGDEGEVTLDDRRCRVNDQRFESPLYTVAQAARLVGMNPSTLSTWAKGYERQRPGRVDVRQGPVITAIEADPGMPTIPFVGLVESTVVEAFRRSGLPMQRIRQALGVLAEQGELQHALASKQLYTDGAEILYDYAGRSGDKHMRLLTIVSSKQIVFHDVIEAYLSRISFGDAWATELIVPVTEHPILRVRPTVAGGEPLFMDGGAPLSAIHDRSQPASRFARSHGTTPYRSARSARRWMPSGRAERQPDQTPLEFFLDRPGARRRPRILDAADVLTRQFQAHG